jgi:enediyne biosynthesis protein E4
MRQSKQQVWIVRANRACNRCFCSLYLTHHLAVGVVPENLNSRSVRGFAHDHAAMALRSFAHPRGSGETHGSTLKLNSLGKPRLPRPVVFCCVIALMTVILLVALPAATQTQNPSTAPTEFTDITSGAGIHFTHFKGNDGISINLEEFGPGICVSDFDRDGWQDIYFVNGRDRYNRGINVKNALYRNNGNGTFTDVTDTAGVPGTNYGLGCVWGDYDNDGWPDLFVTQFGANVLYRNNGDGTFTDVTVKAGVAGMESGSFHAGAVFFDYDHDGKLDLYVGSYVSLGPKARRYCDIGGVKSSCAPAAYSGSLNALYHNNGDGTFTNVTAASKIAQPEGKNLSVGAFDWDNDGWPDLFVANDGLPAYLYENLHNGKFREIAETAGMAYNLHGQAMAAMCISLGDYDNDGWLDLYISDFQKNSDHLWHNSSKGYFDEVSDEAGITLATKDVLSFGGGFLDYDNDGWLDIFIGNGHVYPEIEQVSTDTLYKQHNSLFHNERNRKFSEVSTQGGLNSLPLRAARGVAFADFDNDGYMDIVVANNGDPPTLLHNNVLHKNRFVNFKLVGTKSNRDALGARIKLTAGGVTQIREIAGGGSYLSQSDLRANFGVGDATVISAVEVTWPSGTRQTFRDLAADHFYQLEESQTKVIEQPLHPGRKPQ